jgi:hypothetical protein
MALLYFLEPYLIYNSNDTTAIVNDVNMHNEMDRKSPGKRNVDI